MYLHGCFLLIGERSFFCTLFCFVSLYHIHVLFNKKSFKKQALKRVFVDLFITTTLCLLTTLSGAVMSNFKDTKFFLTFFFYGTLALVVLHNQFHIQLKHPLPALWWIEGIMHTTKPLLWTFMVPRLRLRMMNEILIRHNVSNLTSMCRCFGGPQVTQGDMSGFCSCPPVCLATPDPSLTHKTYLTFLY